MSEVLKQALLHIPEVPPQLPDRILRRVKDIQAIRRDHRVAVQREAWRWGGLMIMVGVGMHLPRVEPILAWMGSVWDTIAMQSDRFLFDFFVWRETLQQMESYPAALMAFVGVVMVSWVAWSKPHPSGRAILR